MDFHQNLHFHQNRHLDQTELAPLLCCSLTEGLISYLLVISISFAASRQYTGL